MARPGSYPFLRAEWRDLVMLNWQVSPDLVKPYVPHGVELDLHDGVTYISVVGFLFAETRLLGLPVPFHRTFEEVNLRFYVRRLVDGEVRRGVTFIREFVPRYAIATLARLAYNEPYRCVQMESEIAGGGAAGSVANRVRYRAGPIEITAETGGTGRRLQPGSIEEFIAEHYWGYTPTRRGGAIEYQVEHPSWLVAHATQAALTGDVRAAYGPAFAATLSVPPVSAFVADGSPVVVYRPTRFA